MSLFEMTAAERRMHIARLLDCNPFAPEDWPMKTIDRLLEQAERAASEAIHHEIIRMTGK
jgi:hypothetical protein